MALPTVALWPASATAVGTHFPEIVLRRGGRMAQGRCTCAWTGPTRLTSSYDGPAAYNAQGDVDEHLAASLRVRAAVERAGGPL